MKSASSVSLTGNLKAAGFKSCSLRISTTFSGPWAMAKSTSRFTASKPCSLASLRYQRLPWLKIETYVYEQALGKSATWPMLPRCGYGTVQLESVKFKVFNIVLDQVVEKLLAWIFQNKLYCCSIDLWAKAMLNFKERWILNKHMCCLWRKIKNPS